MLLDVGRKCMRWERHLVSPSGLACAPMGMNTPPICICMDTPSNTDKCND